MKAIDLYSAVLRLPEGGRVVVSACSKAELRRFLIDRHLVADPTKRRMFRTALVEGRAFSMVRRVWVRWFGEVEMGMSEE